ncbi:MAG: hypothetical protein M0Z69_09110 [Actinomycetota bacterium]|nr:hypothetical protein [Actinomycetota bacterium]
MKSKKLRVALTTGVLVGGVLVGGPLVGGVLATAATAASTKGRPQPYGSSRP